MFVAGESLGQLIGALLPLLVGVMINPPFQLACVVLVIGVGGRRKAGSISAATPAARSCFPLWPSVAWCS